MLFCTPLLLWHPITVLWTTVFCWPWTVCLFWKLRSPTLALSIVLFLKRKLTLALVKNGLEITIEQDHYCINARSFLYSMKMKVYKMLWMHTYTLQFGHLTKSEKPFKVLMRMWALVIFYYINKKTVFHFCDVIFLRSFFALSEWKWKTFFFLQRCASLLHSTL